MRAFKTGPKTMSAAMRPTDRIVTPSNRDGLPADEREPLNALFAIYHSLTGKKYAMAITGFVGVAYVILHMLGNLQVFAGPTKLNAYGALLRSNTALLWAVRIILLAAVILHSVAAYQLARASWKSRPIGYIHWRPVASTYASRAMRWSGPILGLFIIYHLLHLTTGAAHPDFRHGDVYHNVVTGFHVWYVSAVYVVAMLFLGLHLYHGAWSMFLSVGINNPTFNGLIRGIATFFTIITVIGFISIPIAVLLGVIS
jgi:succinate dehydrogenase / fumarate reductase cytochrome b subunit